ISGLYHAALTPAAYASRTMLPPSLQDSLPAGWLAFAGRASTLWIAAKGFRSSILLFWTWPGAREVSFEPPCSFTSFDHLVGAQQQCRGKVDTERFRGREIDGEIELDRILNRKVAGFHTTQNLVHVDRCAPKLVDVARRIRHETAGAYVLPVWIHPR